ncbi:lipoyl domain-containing protein [Streptomyces huasconensis]|uniref:Lipoyl domain-containing protein n=1 Tax=Streptomyces huasconensis TaxID=1854574 RepID=A0ABV3M791_9ACTN
MDLTCPQMGDVGTITLNKWLKREGDHVARDEVVAELATDKAVTELPAPVDGILTPVAREGSVTAPGGLLGFIGPRDES